MNFDTKHGTIFLINKAKSKENSTFKCHCGNIFKTRYNRVIRGETKSCGCLISNMKLEWDYENLGAMSKHPLYRKWQSMKARCYNHKHTSYPAYGGAGISICESWRKSFINFYKWLLDNGWKNGLSIDRIDPTKNYEPDNCRYIEYEENKRLMNEYNYKHKLGIYSTSSANVTKNKARINQGKSIEIDNGTVCEKFNTIGDAARFVVEYKGLSTNWIRIKSNISACCLGKRKKCHGFTCKYTD